MQRKAIALILSIFILVIMFSFVSLSSYQYIADSRLQFQYENSLQTLYELEAAKTAVLWEEAHAPLPNGWDTDTADDTYDSTPRLEGGEVGARQGFYRLTGQNFRTKVLNDGQQISIYIHAFMGTEDNPIGSRYLEYIHAPSPMYRYAMFSNSGLTFSGSALYDCKGGKIHTNKDIEFRPSGNGIMFNRLGEMSASGTIKYGMRRQYPGPYYIDRLDGSFDSMAPAPYYYDSIGYYATTTGELVTPGPFRRWSTDKDGSTTLGWNTFGSWVGANWGTSGKVPLIWRGDETYFYGRQRYGSGYNYSDEAYGRYMYTTDGDLTSNYWTYRNSDDKPYVNRIYLSGSDSLYSYRSQGYTYKGDVHFRPETNKAGESNEEWFQLPGSLPGEYEWSKYRNNYGNRDPVTFYVTEKCSEGTAGCKVDKTMEPANTEGWRYLKKDTEGSVVGQGSGEALTENNKIYNEASEYLKSQDYETGGEKLDYACYSEKYSQCIENKCDADECYSCRDACYTKAYDNEDCVDEEGQTDWPCWYSTYSECYQADCSDSCNTYYSCRNGCYSDAYSACQVNKNYYDNIRANYYDKNQEFFDDYTYGNDADNSSAWLTQAFDAQQQEEGFADYLSILADKNIEGAIQSGVEKKEPFLGQIFDTANEDSQYRTKAQDNGIYIEDMREAVRDLNEEVSSDKKVAEIVSFYNWKTSQQITVLDINVENLKAAGRAPKNGIIYSRYPIRLSNAENLPGTNSGGRNAVFTVIGEESVYLKGNYNSEDWKISNIATKKKVYTLSDEFNDPEEAPDWAIYPEYPYIYVAADKNVDGEVTKYYPQEVSSESGNGAWINANYVYSTYNDEYTYYYGMEKDIRDWVRETRDKKQSDYVASGINPPNRVCEEGSASCSYEYNSLFISPYDENQGDHSLENWYYIDKEGKERKAEKNMVGAFLNFYDKEDPDYDDEYRSSLGSEETTWDYNREATDNPNMLDGTTPLNNWYIRNYGARIGYSNPTVNQEYDDRFPQASPSSSEGVLGFTGGNSWRTVGSDYFYEKSGTTKEVTAYEKAIE